MIDEKVLIEALNHQAYYSCSHCMEDAIEVVKKLAEESKGKDTNVPSNNIEKSYISRTEVLLLIESIKDNKDIPKNYGTLLDILRQIRNMPTVSIDNGWIPCSERLPEEDGWYYTTLNYRNAVDSGICKFVDGKWSCSENFEVIAWEYRLAPYEPKE